MKRLILIAAGVLILMAPLTAWTQGFVSPATTTPGNFSGVARPDELATANQNLGFSLLDLSRLKVNHSYSMSYFSGGGRSGSIGMYMSTIEYQFSKPLSVRVGLGYLHQPLGFLNNSSVGPDGGRFLPNVRLEYRPTENMHFIVDYRTLPTSAYGTGYNRSLFSPYSSSMQRLWDW